jgi:hypothetical protein
MIVRDSRRTPVAKIPRPRRISDENRTAASAQAAKSPPRIDITLRHRDTQVHDHQNQILHE